MLRPSTRNRSVDSELLSLELTPGMTQMTSDPESLRLLRALFNPGVPLRRYAKICGELCCHCARVRATDENNDPEYVASLRSPYGSNSANVASTCAAPSNRSPMLLRAGAPSNSARQAFVRLQTSASDRSS